MSQKTPVNVLKFYEFFAGGGMARAGLGTRWECLFANDFDARKAETYRRNWNPANLLLKDIHNVSASDIPGIADLAWASFPCQDLSLAGGGAGLKGERSGTFYPFWEAVKGLIKDGRAPRLIALENVAGTLSSHGGKDFAAICETFAAAGYRYGAVVIDAALFVPHSRQRLFVIGVRSDLQIDSSLVSDGPQLPFHSRGLQTALSKVAPFARKSWIWWNLPTPSPRKAAFGDLVESDPLGVRWHSPEETERLLSQMSPINAKKVESAKRMGKQLVGSVYKRTRKDQAGVKGVRAEARFDGIAGCLRTPAGGSSRQVILVVEGRHVKSRLISARETARLMGLPESYQLPSNYNEAYHLTGDGVAVPVVAYVAKHLFEPLLQVDAIAEAA
jgi:DNA (cytosine-5)-methyltransferase 1